MKSVKALMTILCVFGLLFASDASAQKGTGAGGGMGMRGWGPGTHYMMLYNSQTVETITGEVVSVDRIAPMKGMSYGVHVKVKTATETIPVHLGPAWFLDPQETHILKGDKVTVIGSRVDYQGKPAIIAAEVKKGEDTFRLRDENGFPAWSGWRRQQMQMKQP